MASAGGSHLLFICILFSACKEVCRKSEHCHAGEGDDAVHVGRKAGINCEYGSGNKAQYYEVQCLRVAAEHILYHLYANDEPCEDSEADRYHQQEVEFRNGAHYYSVDPEEKHHQRAADARKDHGDGADADRENEVHTEPYCHTAHIVEGFVCEVSLVECSHENHEYECQDAQNKVAFFDIVFAGLFIYGRQASQNKTDKAEVEQHCMRFEQDNYHIAESEDPCRCTQCQGYEEL